MEEAQEEGTALDFPFLLQVLKKQFYIFTFLKFAEKRLEKKKKDSTPNIVWKSVKLGFIDEQGGGRRKDWSKLILMNHSFVCCKNHYQLDMQLSVSKIQSGDREEKRQMFKYKHLFHCILLIKPRTQVPWHRMIIVSLLTNWTMF